MLHRNIHYRLYPLTRTKVNKLNQDLSANRFVQPNGMAQGPAKYTDLLRAQMMNLTSVYKSEV